MVSTNVVSSYPILFLFAEQICVLQAPKCAEFKDSDLHWILITTQPLGNPPNCYKTPVSKLGLNWFKRNTINGTYFSSSTYMLRLLVWILEWEPNNLPFLHQAAKIIWDKVETKGRSKSPAIAHGKSNWRKNRVQYIYPAGTFQELKHLIFFFFCFFKVV